IREKLWRGCATGTLDLKSIQEMLRPYLSDKIIRLIITDTQDRIIVSTDPKQAPMQPWNLKKTGVSEPISATMFFWHPGDKKLPSMTRWKQSFYVQETLFRQDLPWKLIVEASVAPLQSTLYIIYVKNLYIVAVLTALALLLSQLFSGALTRPLTKLAKVTANLPEKLTSTQDIEWPVVFTQEMDLLINNFKSMAQTLKINFTKLKLQSDELSQGNRNLSTEVKERQNAEEALRESEKAARRLAQENELIAEIGRIIGSSLNIDEVYERFAEEVHKLIAIDRTTINIINPQDNTATTAYISGTELSHRKKGDVFPLAFTITDEVSRTRTSLLINEENYHDYLERLPGIAIGLQAGFRSLMMIPLISQDEVVAVLQFRSTKLSTYSEKELKLAERVGNQIAGSIANAQLFRERTQVEEQLQHTLDSLRKSMNATIQVMVSTVEARDPYTAGHQLKSANLARAIATEMGLPQEKIDAIRMAGSIHDIGKISIPAEILSKPTKLTEIEFSLIKEHARRGYEMLKHVESPWPLAEIVYQHHERMDGSGYPRKLRGEEILMEARVLSVADVVEAMASHRPYRPGLGIDTALNEIEKNSGVFYDNAVANACLRLFREKGFKLEGA
ncbi:MAG: HD domain-containing protein, partial [Deltaproteobacteria bacterium]|nr:HD domain-containing protein [Deltaproteobacteria bacterium]